MKSALALPSFVFGLSLAAGAAVPFIDNFNDGDSAGWTEHDPLQTATGGALGPFATYSFPGGNSYRIEAAASFDPGAAGPGRAFSLRQDEVLGDAIVTWDAIGWNDNVPQVFGGLARIAQPGLGTTDGYAFVYGPQSSGGAGGLDLFIIQDEAVVGLAAATVSVDLNPAFDYHFVFGLSGTTLTGSVFDITNGGPAVATITGSDATYSSGFAGLLVADAAGPSIGDATFDNFYAVPEPASATLALLGLGLFLRRRR
jgi:hypothetical protein